MAIPKSIVQKVDEQIRLHTSGSLISYVFSMGKHSPFDSIPPRLLHQALFDYLPKLKDRLGEHDHELVGGAIIKELGQEGWIREKLVRLGRLGQCLGMVEQALGCNPKLGWLNDPFLTINRLQNKKFSRIDLRAIGQIQRDAPQLLNPALNVNGDGNPGVVAATTLLFLMSALQKHEMSKVGILGRAELEDMAWAVVGLVQQCQPDSIANAGMRAAFCAGVLANEGVELPALNADASLLAKSDEKRDGPTPQAWSALRRAILTYNSERGASPKQARKPDL